MRHSNAVISELLTGSISSSQECYAGNFSALTVSESSCPRKLTYKDHQRVVEIIAVDFAPKWAFGVTYMDLTFGELHCLTGSIRRNFRLQVLIVEDLGTFCQNGLI